MATVATKTSSITVEQYLTRRGVQYAYITVDEEMIKQKDGVKKWSVSKTSWSGTNKACRWTPAEWKKNAGNKLGMPEARFVPKIDAPVGAKRRNEYLAYASSADCVVLDIDDSEGFAKGYPDIDLSTAPRYLSRNKRLEHVFADLSMGSRRKIKNRKGVKAGGKPVADLCTGQMLWARPNEQMIMPDAALLSLDIETFLASSKKRKTKAKSKARAKSAPRNCLMQSNGKATPPPSDDGDDGDDSTATLFYTEYSDMDKYPHPNKMEKGLAIITDQFCAYLDWFRIGTILKMMYPRPHGLQLFSTFSKDRPGYVSEEDVEKHFNGFDPLCQGMSCGTLYHYIRESNPVKYEEWRATIVGESLMLAGDVGLGDAYHIIHGAEHLRITSEKGAGYLWSETRRLWCETGKIVIRCTVARQLIKSLQHVIRLRKAKDHKIWQKLNEESPELATTKKSKELKGLLRVMSGLRMSQGQRGVVEQVMNTRCLRPEFQTEVNSSKHELPIRDGYVLDLRTGESRLRKPHDQWSFELDVSNRGTMCPDAMADANRFFLSIANGDQDLANYIIAILGYSLTAETTEHNLFVFWGAGSNGKSTLVDILTKIMKKFFSPLAEQAMIDTGSGSSATPELMCLMSARLAILSETRQGAKLNDSRIKSLTGGDTITIRALYCDPIEIKPVATLALITNHKPEFEVSSDGMKRRVVMVPFVAKFEHTQENSAYVQSLSRPAVLDCIFSLLVNGAMAYYKNGTLRKPAEACLRATKEHINELDTVSAFLSDCSQPSKRGWPCSACYEAYGAWCEDQAKRPLSAKKFHASMTGAQNIVRKRGKFSGSPKKQSFFALIEPKDESESEDEDEE